MSSKKTHKTAKKKPAPPVVSGDFDSLVSSIVHNHQQTQDFATKAVNVALTLRNWLIGCRIVEFEQQGKDRAAYGESLMDTLALRLASHGLTRVTPRELRRYRQLYQVYPRIWESLAPKSLAQQGFGPLLRLLPSSPLLIRESVTPESQIVETATPQLIHRLSFTHLNELIQLPDDTQRRFYEIECIRGNWSVRELRRQIASLYYHRVLKCHILVELKTDAFRHEHLGQLNTYVAYNKKHQMTPGDQPPVGILLCTRKNEALVEFALGDLSNQVFVSRYAVELPRKEEMERFITQLGKEVKP